MIGTDKRRNWYANCSDWNRYSGDQRPGLSGLDADEGGIRDGLHCAVHPVPRHSGSSGHSPGRVYQQGDGRSKGLSVQAVPSLRKGNLQAASDSSGGEYGLEKIPAVCAAL